MWLSGCFCKASLLPVLLGTETKKDAKCSRFGDGGGGGGTDNCLGVAGMDTAGVDDEIKKSVAL